MHPIRHICTLLIENPAARRWLNRFSGPAGMARVLAATADPGPDFDPARPTVLCLNRVGFDQDIRAMRRFEPRYNFVAVMNASLGNAQVWLPPEMLLQRAFYNQQKEGPRNKSLEFARHFLRIMTRRYDLACILSGNFNYYQDECLKAVCPEFGIPHLVLSRENIATTPQDFEDAIERHQDVEFHYQGEAIASPSQMHKDLMVGCGVKEAERIHLTGLPRMDFIRSEEGKDRRDTITLFAYYRGKAENFGDVMNAFADSARHNPAIRYMVKLKVDTDAPHVRSLVRGEPSANLEITSQGNIHDLLHASRAVVSYNSTTLQDSLLADVAIGIPWWGDPLKEEGHQFSPNDPEQAEAVHFLPDPGALRTFLDDVAQGRLEEKATPLRMNLLSRQVFIHPERLASNLVGDFIERYARNGRNAEDQACA